MEKTRGDLFPVHAEEVKPVYGNVMYNLAFFVMF